MKPAQIQVFNFKVPFWSINKVRKLLDFIVSEIECGINKRITHFDYTENNAIAFAVFDVFISGEEPSINYLVNRIKSEF
jgi:hypothetical protein